MNQVKELTINKDLNKMTKSKKKKDSLINKTELWNIFDQEIYPEKCDPLECVYRSCGNRENCDVCDNIN